MERPRRLLFEAREVGRFKVRMLHHELIWRRHTKEVRDLVGGVADDAKCFAGFKGAGDDDPSAGMKHGVGVTGWSPPVWNSGKITSCTVSGVIQLEYLLTQFQNVMPCVMIAPFGGPSCPRCT